MQVLDKELTIPYTIELLESILDYEEFKILTWDIEPVNGVYNIKASHAKFYGILM
jgi:hypothetical protein